MLVANTEYIAGKKIVKTLGLVKGTSIRAKWFGKDVMAVIRNIIGGEVKEYTELLTESREQATERMMTEAEKLGADAIVNVRYSTAQVMSGAAEIIAYGTAVKLNK